MNQEGIRLQNENQKKKKVEKFFWDKKAKFREMKEV